MSRPQIGTLILAIDTSGSLASVAVYAGQVQSEMTWRSGRHHSLALIAAIDRALELAGAERRALGAIALAAGPGSYSGLRVGASTAIGLSLALDIPIIEVPTLEIIAAAAPAEPGDLRPAIEVGRGRYASARYRRRSDALVAVGDIESSNLAELLARVTDEGSVLIGDFDTDELASSPARLVAGAAGVRRAGLLAERAARRLERSDHDARDAQPQLIYLTP